MRTYGSGFASAVLTDGAFGRKGQPPARWRNLSGADPGLVPAVLAFAAQGGWAAGQHGEGCYDPAAASQLIDAGMTAGTPEQLASELVQRSLA